MDPTNYGPGANTLDLASRTNFVTIPQLSLTKSNNAWPGDCPLLLRGWVPSRTVLVCQTTRPAAHVAALGSNALPSAIGACNRALRLVFVECLSWNVSRSWKKFYWIGLGITSTRAGSISISETLIINIVCLKGMKENRRTFGNEVPPCCVERVVVAPSDVSTICLSSTIL